MTENSIVYRALAEPLEFPGSDGLTLEGYAAVFDRAAHIEDHLGSYDEVIKPGAFTRSINARKPFLLYQHGRHPLVGQFPLGTIETLREDSHGLFVRARLVDTWITQPVRDGIRDRAITGMSVAMESPRNQAVWSTSPGGTKLRTVREAKLYELGPVLGPAYADTTVALRSMLDGLPPELRAHLANDTNARTLPDNERAKPMSTHFDRLRIAATIKANQRAQRAREIRRDVESRACHPLPRSYVAARIRAQGGRLPEERALEDIARRGDAAHRGVILGPSRPASERYRNR